VSASNITDKESAEIQAAMAVALLQLKIARGLTYERIGKVIGREKQSVGQYISGTTEMPATCWVRAIAEWPELADRLHFNLDDAEQAFRARQRSLGLDHE
jgi:cyanate lyase